MVKTRLGRVDPQNLVIDNGVTVGVVLLRLRTLEVNLEEEGAYTRSNTAWLAAETIRELINIANRSK